MSFKMRQAMVVLFAAMLLAGCQDRPENSTTIQSGSNIMKAVAENADEKALLESYLQAIRQGDKEAMYTLSDLTPELVEKSRLLLINQKKENPSATDIADAEVALSMSGSIDYYLKKLPQMVFLPKAELSFVKAVAAPQGVQGFVYLLEVRYPDAANAVQDKDGKAVKKLHLKMGVVNHALNSGLKLREFVVDTTEFSNLLGREYNVQEYF